MNFKIIDLTRACIPSFITVVDVGACIHLLISNTAQPDMALAMKDCRRHMAFRSHHYKLQTLITFA